MKTKVGLLKKFKRGDYWHVMGNRLDYYKEGEDES
jgi:hypothetical protein